MAALLPKPQVIQIKQPRSTSVTRWLVLLCLVLVAVVGTAQALHFHADDLAATDKHCPLCQTLHSTTPLVHTLQLNFSFQAVAYFLCRTSSHKQSVYSPFALFSRPPPLV